jgi:hypothetical protein
MARFGLARRRRSAFQTERRANVWGIHVRGCAFLLAVALADNNFVIN